MSDLWDNLVLASTALLMFFTPFAFGSVDPWSLALAECLCFSLTIFWFGKVCLTPGAKSDWLAFSEWDFRALAIPTLALLGFIAFQLVPLPPRVIAVLSPQAHQLYVRSLPGWPTQLVYQQREFQQSFAKRKRSADPVVLPTADGVKKGATVPFIAKSRGPAATASADENASKANSPAPIPGAGAWRSISVLPALTRASLLKSYAYACLFFVMVFYPAGFGSRDDERRFRRIILLIVLAAGATVAIVGLVEQAFWNGKILWFHVPHDWAGPAPGPHRASGPFVDPDHFAVYLAMTLPLAIVGAMFRAPLARSPSFTGFQFVCAASAVMMVAAILISQSRAGLIEVGIVFLTLAWMLRRHYQQRLDDELVRKVPQSSSMWALAVGGFGVAALVLALVLVGAGQREQAGGRLAESFSTGVGMTARFRWWADTGRMIHDFPIFGVGLGAWSAVFPHYQRPPWSPYFVNAAHNDYIEAAAEYGLGGLLLFGWLCWTVGRILKRGSGSFQSSQWIIFSALVASILVVAFDELGDFCLQIPANAMLFVLIVALATRIARSHVARTFDEPGILTAMIAPAAIALVAMIAVVWAVRQKEIDYPDDLPFPKSTWQAEAEIVSHPSSPYPHLWLANMLHDQSGRWPVAELDTAVWLDPNNPKARDWYIVALLRDGRFAEALKELSRATFHAPAQSDHFYLSLEVLPYLSEPQRTAIETGLGEAANRGFDGAVDSLATLYTAEKRTLDAARLYDNAARAEDDPALRFRYYLGAGEAYASSGRAADAERTLLAAIDADPYDFRSYRDLISLVYGPARNEASAKRVIEMAASRGIDAGSLYLELARVDEEQGHIKSAEKALRDAVSYEPSYRHLMLLGQFYLRYQNYDSAAELLRRAVKLAPQSGQAYFYLAQAEEGDYQYPAAKADYSRAIALAPGNREFQSRRSDLLRKIDDHSRAAGVPGRADSAVDR